MSRINYAKVNRYTGNRIPSSDDAGIPPTSGPLHASAPMAKNTAPTVMQILVATVLRLVDMSTG
jgi:hypothetical protein